MIMKKLVFTTLFSIAMICSCTEQNEHVQNPDDVKNPEEVVTKLPINLSTRIISKVTDSEFENGDNVGIYTVNYEYNGEPGYLHDYGNHLDNVRFEFYDGCWTPEREVFWKDQVTLADFYCYYPYRHYFDNTSYLVYDLESDQSEIDRYKSNDILYGKASGVAPSKDPVVITTNHMMSNVVIYVVPGNGYTDESLAEEEISVSIINVRHRARLNLRDGRLETYECEPTEIRPLREENYWKALIVPQEVHDTDLIRVNVGANQYTLRQSVTFQPNKRQVCTITVNRIGEGVNIGIGGWENDDHDFGGVVE